MDSLESDVECIKDDIVSLNKKIDNIPNHIMSDCIKEISDRSIRSSNIIFFNAPEKILNAGASNCLSDCDFTTKFVNFLFPANPPKSNSIIRLGKHQQMSPRTRPLRVTFVQESHVQKEIDAFRDFKLTNETPPDFSQPNLSLS